MIKLFRSNSLGSYLLRLLFCTIVLGAYLEQSTSPVFAQDAKKSKAESAAERKRKAREARKAKLQKLRKEKASNPKADETGAFKSDGFSDTSAAESSDLKQTGGIDAILLIDGSRSMQRTDPERLRLEGAKLFHRFLTEEDRVAVMEFSRKATLIKNFTEIRPDKPGAIDAAIDSVSQEGGFTNIEVGLADALRLLQDNERPNSVKCVVLLSDGKMDPHPREGTREATTKLLFDIDVPDFKNDLVRVYTVALSDQADQELLSNIASATRGLFWYAPDAETLHSKFSDLFLALKKPQIISLSGNAFNVDDSIKEATFYISSSEQASNLRLIDPRGLAITRDSHPESVKWFRGSNFDMITIKDPLKGIWIVQGVAKPEGFATLLTALSLEVRWAEQNLSVGDEITVFARLIENGELFSAPGVEDVLVYSFKIFSTRTGMPLLAGKLTDDGENGDLMPGDKIFSSKLKFDQQGDYKALITVKGPTFTRQQLVPFSVREQMVRLTLEEPDVFSGKPELFRVKMSREAMAMANLRLFLFAKPPGQGPSIEIPVEQGDSEDVFEALTSEMPAGKYTVFAKIGGQNRRGANKEETFVSNRIEFEKADESGNVPEIADIAGPPEEKKPKGVGNILKFLGFVSLSIFWALGLGIFGYLKASGGKDLPEEIEPPELNSELSGLMDEMREKASEQRRAPGKEDAVFKEALSDLEKDSKADEPKEKAKEDSSDESEPAEDKQSENVDEPKQDNAEQEEASEAEGEPAEGGAAGEDSEQDELRPNSEDSESEDSPQEGGQEQAEDEQKEDGKE